MLHSGIFFNPILVRCLFNAQWPIAHLSCFLLSFSSSLVFAMDGPPGMNTRDCLISRSRSRIGCISDLVVHSPILLQYCMLSCRMIQVPLRQLLRLLWPACLLSHCLCCPDVLLSIPVAHCYIPPVSSGNQGSLLPFYLFICLLPNKFKTQLQSKLERTALHYKWIPYINKYT